MLTPVSIARSGFIASGQIGWPHMASGAVQSGDLAITAGVPDGTKFLRDDFSWVNPPTGGLTSGAVQSGHISSGAVEGFFGPTRQIASGSVGVFDFGSGAVIAGTVGSGAILSGNIASGQVGPNSLASGIITSGIWIGSGTILGQKGGGPFNIASGSIGTNDIGSGQVQSGNILSGNVAFWHLSSGSVRGFVPGGVRHILSGSIGDVDLASGQIVGNLSVVGVGTRRHIASGSLDGYNFASGALADWSQYLLANVSGLGRFPPAITQETVSGVRAVNLTASGTLQVAMASVATRMPACGIVTDNVASGIPANVFLFGQLQFSSGLADYSGYVGTILVVGRSGQIVTQSGSFNSGGLLSGDAYQPVGLAVSSGAAMLQLASPPVSGSYLGSGVAGSGSIASGAVQGFFGQTRNIASGTVGVFDFGSGAVIAGTVGSGAIQSGNIASGQVGNLALASGSITSGVAIGSGAIWGRAGVNQFMICSGTIKDFDIASGGVLSGNIASGQIGPKHLASGIITSGVYVGSGTIMGQAGGGPFQISSGTIGQLNLASGIITSGVYVGSGAIEGRLGGGPFNIASGSIGTFDIGSGQVVSGLIASGQVGSLALASGCLADYSQYQLNYTSGLSHVSILTGETISGVRAVAISQSGFLRVAMASVSGRMPAIGVVMDNVASGIQVNVYTGGAFQPSSGLFELSGVYGNLVYVGRSGTVSTASGWFNSGGLLSGDVSQPIGWQMGSGQVVLSVAATLPFVPGLVTSGNIASGQIASPHLASGAVLSGNLGSGQLGTYHHASGTTVTNTTNVTPLWSGNSFKAAISSEPISGIKAVCVDITNSGAIRIAMAATSGRMPAIGVVADNVLSGIPVNVIANGYVPFGSGIMGSGYLQGRTLWVGFSGDIVAWSGGYGSGGWAVLSGLTGQQMGILHFTASGRTSGAYIISTNPTLSSGLPITVGTIPLGF